MKGCVMHVGKIYLTPYMTPYYNRYKECISCTPMLMARDFCGAAMHTALCAVIVL